MRQHSSFWIGFFAAALLSLPVALGIMGVAEEQLLRAALYASVGIATLVFVLVVALFFRDWILRRLLGRTEVALQDVVGSLSDSVMAASQGDRAAAATHAQAFVQTGVGWYTWTSFYRWVIGSATALLLAFGAFVGTVLLFEQTRLLGVQTERLTEQNTRISEQTALMTSQTALMELQTDRLREQTTQAVIQNEIMTVSLVSELRDQMLSTAQDVSLPDLFASTGLDWETDVIAVDGDNTCALAFDDPGPLTRPPSDATIKAIAKLAREGELAARVREALEFLTEDRSSVVALSAVKVLDELNTGKSYNLWQLEGVFLDDFTLKGPHRLDFERSVVTETQCDLCTMTLAGSLASETMNVGSTPDDVFIFDTVLIGDHPYSTGRRPADALIFSNDAFPEDVPFLTSVRSGDAVLSSFGEFAAITSAQDRVCEGMQELADLNRFVRYIDLTRDQEVLATPADRGQ